MWRFTGNKSQFLRRNWINECLHMEFRRAMNRICVCNRKCFAAPLHVSWLFGGCLGAAGQYWGLGKRANGSLNLVSFGAFCFSHLLFASVILAGPPFFQFQPLVSACCLLCKKRWWNSNWAISNPERWCCESATLKMPANLENSTVATGLAKVSFHSNPKERQCQRMLKLLHNCTHLTC